MFQFFFIFLCAILKLGEPLRDTPAGQFLRFIGFKSWLYYPEELPGFQPPIMDDLPEDDPLPNERDLEKTTMKVPGTVEVIGPDIDRQSSQKNLSEAVIVTWTENDKANPRNWSDLKKAWVMVVVNIYTFVVYCSASIITPTADAVMQRYGVSFVVASLGLSMYVVGYGIGPMFLSPISEIPRVGRNPPYLYPFILFFIVSLILCFIDNFAGIVVLRFLQGLFGSPCLASGVASIEDVYDMYSAPYGYIWWVASMYCGPALGPLLGGYSVVHNWRWPVYEIVIMSSVVLLVLPFLPETSPSTILLNRAKRLRKATGNNSYLASCELNPVPFSSLLKDALNKPSEITIKDPCIAYACIYGAIIYSTYYSFFEAFPLVYLGTYGLSLGGLGLIFTSLIIGCIVGLIFYYWYLRAYFIPRARKYHDDKGVPLANEQWLKPGLVGVWGPAAGLFIFAWTARADIHWIVPTMGIGIFACTSFWVFQSLVCYIPLTYPKYVASLFAANDFTRSILAAGFVQFSTQMYLNLGIDRGVSLVAGLSLVGVLGHFGLYRYGALLRARSKFTE